MLTHPEFAEVPARKRGDFQYRLYVTILASFAAFLLLTSDWRVSALVLAPAVVVGVILWLRRRRNPWSAKVTSRAPHDERIRLGWTRHSDPQYAGRGDTLFPQGTFGGGGIYEGYASLPLAVAATLFLLPAVLGGVVIGAAMWLKRQFERPVKTFLIR